MTNEEKAKELMPTMSGYYEIMDALLNMAQWKDEQFSKEKQAIIDNAVRFIRDNIESDRYNSPDEESYRMGYGVDYFETNMFIEDLKKYMKGE